jgi:imidazolonepropionase-like amidohydrolase
MNKILFCLGIIFSCYSVSAQDMVIINAHIIDGTGTNILNGSLVVVDGKINSVSEGLADTSNRQVINAAGMTLLPGFIDAHRHIIGRNIERWFDEESETRMQEFLEAGFTTLMSASGRKQPLGSPPNPTLFFKIAY